MQLTPTELKICNKGKELQKKIGMDVYSSQLQELFKISRPNMSLYLKILKAKGKVKKAPRGAGSIRIHFV